MSTSKTVNILGVPISILGFDQFLSDFDAQIRSESQRSGGSVNFVNVHTVVESQHDADLRDLFQTATFNVADGLPLVWVSKVIQSRVCGPDVMHALLERYPNLTHGFIGGAVHQGNHLIERYSLKKAWVYAPPFRSFSPENTLEDWNRFLQISGGVAPQIVWVGLGAPKQEKWVAEIRKFAPHTWFFAVGAAFDFLTGTKSRAPLWMQRCGLEWLYRLISEPRRLIRRYLRTNTEFCFRVALQWLRSAKKYLV